MSELSERIEKLIYEKNISRTELARQTGTSEGTIRNWSVRDSSPSVEAAYKVAQYFGVTVEWLVTGTDQKDTLSAEEKELLELFRTLDERDKQTILTLSRSLEAQYYAKDKSSAASG